MQSPTTCTGHSETMDSIGNFIGPYLDSKGILWGFFVDFYKDSGFEEVLKNFYKDSSWSGVSRIPAIIL